MSLSCPQSNAWACVLLRSRRLSPIFHDAAELSEGAALGTAVPWRWVGYARAARTAPVLAAQTAERVGLRHRRIPRRLGPWATFGCDEVPTAEAVALLKRLTDHALYGDWTELEATTSQVDASGWAWGVAADAKVAQLVSTLSGATLPSAPVPEGAADGGATAGKASRGVSAHGNEHR
jgi:hypothetical protein